DFLEHFAELKKERAEGARRNGSSRALPTEPSVEWSVAR
ncbi:MAG: hypothetical protein QOC66_1602, partial [Pseudonocardiales bacterium]|nr:hypothetical protein [Pseudonocardiales bacterium]